MFRGGHRRAGLDEQAALPIGLLHGLPVSGEVSKEVSLHSSSCHVSLASTGKPMMASRSRLCASPVAENWAESFRCSTCKAQGRAEASQGERGGEDFGRGSRTGGCPQLHLEVFVLEQHCAAGATEPQRVTWDAAQKPREELVLISTPERKARPEGGLEVL